MNRLFSASRTTRLFLLFSLSTFGLYSATGWGQVAAGPPPSRMAVIDIKYILENHQRFKSSMELMKKQFEAAGKELQDERNQIVQMDKQLSELNPGTSDYNQLEERITRMKADWTVKANKLKKDIRNQESQILWNVYYEIQTETKRYCEQNGIGLVVQFNGDEIDSHRPEEVVKGMSRPIVYNAAQLDITPWILKALHGGARPAVPAPRVGGKQGVLPPRR
ncbi:MAG: hypothetical protein GTO53_11085 [Planctomycetales bacterium]|nr:hypothetical protein [Planctomycetales bacterium]NIM09662.1 hypothetical protein [Planctomycetales bacterium]NIN78252.1 hypothetical protein [Planctomycetales bacterium]NIO35443.1 hypothetical protein [Planctomycetales bacterium]NIO47188.1 hypothetical protein [Planctomycetales bacterium]